MNTVIENEFRAFGRAGCGKTNWIHRQVERSYSKYDPSQIGIASFTRAGATEALSRITLPHNNIGTIHGFCYHMMDDVTIIGPKQIKEWNNMSYPMNGSEGDKDEPSVMGRQLLIGDRYRAEVESFVNRCLPIPTYLHDFNASWQSWKQDNGYIDFTDMLLEGFNHEKPFADCDVLFIDEAQDLNALQAKLIRHWGSNLDKYVLVGDDDQCIYEFAHATPDTLIEGLNPETTVYLQHGFRVPKEIHDYAECIIQRVQKRIDKPYTPPEHSGEVCHMFARDARNTIDNIEADLERGSVMLLAPSARQLWSFAHELKDRGIPFHNPYRTDRGDWNPLPYGKGKRLGTSQRVQAYLKADIFDLTWDKLWVWAELLSDTAFQLKGGKARIKRERAENPEGFVDNHALYALFGFDLDAIADHSPEWFARHIRVERFKSVDYALRVVRRGGAVESLSEPPKLTLGTIHSVKGGEADYVHVVAELPRQFRELIQSSACDQLYRLFYVACTRARKGLRIVGHNGIL